MADKLLELLQQLTNGLSQGAIYALIALGYTMVFGVLRFINFAHGDVYMLGAFVGYWLGPKVVKMGASSSVPGWGVIFAMVVVGALVGIFLGRRMARLLGKWMGTDPVAQQLAGPDGLGLGLQIVGALLGAVVAYFFARWSREFHPAVIVVVGTMCACAVIGIVIEWLCYRPLRNRPKLTVLITAIGVSLFLENGGQFAFGADPKSFPEIFVDRAIEIPEAWGKISGLTITVSQVLNFVVTLILLFGLTYIVRNTKMGMAMRALSLNPVAAQLMGININVIIAFTFGLGSALAGAAGILTSVQQPSIEPLMGVNAGLKAFVAAVLGGIGNLPGAALGGVLIGLTEALVVGYGEEYGLAVLGIPVLLLALVAIRVSAFRRGIKWGLPVLVIPLVDAFYAIKFWPKTRALAITYLVGIVMTFIGPVVKYCCGTQLTLPPTYRDPIVFGVLILVLLVKPTGLLGASEREKV